MVTPPLITSEGISWSPKSIYEPKLVNVDGIIEKENPMSNEHIFVCMWNRLAVGKKSEVAEEWSRKMEDKRGK